MANNNRNWRSSIRAQYPEWEDYNNPYSEYRESRDRGNLIYGQDYGYQNPGQYGGRGRVMGSYEPDNRYGYDRYGQDFESEYPGQNFDRRYRNYNDMNDDRDYAYRGYGNGSYGRAYSDYEPRRNREYGGGQYRGKYSRDRYNDRRDDRDWWDRTSDEVSSWFGDHDAERRRERDRRYGNHRGKGPKGYSRSDERISEDIHDRLSDDPFLDATNIEISVNNREVIINGNVQTRGDKRRAEEIVESVSGVTHFENRLRLNAGGFSENSSSSDNNATNERNRSAKYDEIQV